MDKKKRFFQKPSYYEIYIAGSFVIYLGTELLCRGLGLYDVMIGREGLKNIIFAIIFKWTSTLCIAVPPFIFGALFINFIYSTRFVKRWKALIAGVGFLTFTVPLMLIMGLTKVPFDEQQFVTGRITDPMYIGTFSDCVKDILADEYEIYTVNELWYNGSKETSSDSEIRLSAYFNETRGAVECSWEMFEAQIGKKDYENIRSSDTAVYGTDAVVTVYINSRFIRSFESEEYAGEGETV